jgi:hypothetical protein
VVPASRSDFKAYCLRRLGSGVIEVNVSDDQVEDRIDEALSFWYDYSYSGTEKVYLKHQVTDADVASGYIELPENIIGAVRFLPLTTNSSAISNPFDIQYQIALNDIFSLTSFSLIPFYAANMQLELIRDMLVGKVPLRYNRMANRAYFDGDWSQIAVGQWLIVEAYGVVDPETWTRAFGDRTLQNYCAALIKRVWAQNLSKYEGMQLPGGITVNGTRMALEADQEIEKYERFIQSGNLPGNPILLG